MSARKFKRSIQRYRRQQNTSSRKPSIPTYWNGEPCAARIVRVVVGRAERETYWYAGLTGTVREAVEVSQHGQTFYIDNALGEGWAKVTEGRGSPQWGHSSLAVERVINEVLE